MVPVMNWKPVQGVFAPFALCVLEQSPAWTVFQDGYGCIAVFTVLMCLLFRNESYTADIKSNIFCF